MLSAFFILLLAASNPATGRLPAQAQDHLEKGNKFYELGLYNEAGREYSLAADLCARNDREVQESAVLSYNLGNVYHQKMVEAKRLGEGSSNTTAEEWCDRAERAYKRAVQAGSPALAAKAMFNLGTTLAAMGKKQEAMKAFREALRLAPDDPDAKHNLEVLLKGAKDKRSGKTEPLTVKGPETIAEGEGEGEAQAEGQSPGQGTAMASGPTPASANDVTSADKSPKSAQTQIKTAQAEASSASSTGAGTPKENPVLDKANKLEQRMIDGWARPPDFQKPDEKDW